MREKIKNISKKGAYWISIAIIGIVVGISIQFVRAWTGPNAAAPNGAVNAPIVTNPSTKQTIFGNIDISGVLHIKKMVVDSGGSITLNGQERSSWPSSAYQTGGTCDLTEWELATYGCPNGSFLSYVFNTCGEGGCSGGYEDRCAFLDPSKYSRGHCWGSGGASPVCAGRTAGDRVTGNPIDACSGGTQPPVCSWGYVTDGTQIVPVYTCNADGTATQEGTRSVTCSYWTNGPDDGYGCGSGGGGA